MFGSLGNEVVYYVSYWLFMAVEFCFRGLERRKWRYFEMCLTWHGGFDKMVSELLTISTYLSSGAHVVFACDQGKDRSVLLARAVMVHGGLPTSDVVADNLRLANCQLFV